MVYRGHIHNGVVVFDTLAALPDGTAVRVEPMPPSADPDCFATVREIPEFEPAALEAMRAKLTRAQFEALKAIARQGDPDVDVVARLRAASLT